MCFIKNDDPIWEQHSGGSGHLGTEWNESDGALAKDLYAALPDHTRFVFDLMIDRPGERRRLDRGSGVQQTGLVVR